MKALFLEALSFASFDLKPSDIESINERTLLVKKWNWDYNKAHQFQRHCLSFLQDHAQARILICCNHPHVLTHGRGLQRSKKDEALKLIAFNPENYPSLPYPLFHIERGGGLTFHHPGQFIFYPIVKLNPDTLSLSMMMNDLFKYSKEILTEWGIQDLSCETKLLGLWCGTKKMASLGIAIEKLTTFHGMALNLYTDHEMKKSMRVLNPCGLTADTYVAADEMVALPDDALEKFTTLFLQRIAHAWK